MTLLLTEMSLFHIGPQIPAVILVTMIGHQYGIDIGTPVLTPDWTAPCQYQDPGARSYLKRLPPASLYRGSNNTLLLSLSLFVCLCVCVCLSLSVSLCLCVCLSLSVSLFLCVCLSLSLSLSLSLQITISVVLSHLILLSTILPSSSLFIALLGLSLMFCLFFFRSHIAP